MKADLHTHTVLSDAALTVDALMDQAKRIGLDYIAVTDHNSTHSIPAVTALGKELGIGTIPALEVTAYHEESQIRPHLLCYYLKDFKRVQRKLNPYLQLQKEAKLQAYEALMEDYPITKEQLFEAARESTTIYKVHIMKVLSSLGYTGTPIGELHDKLFETGSKYDVTQDDIPIEEAVNVVRSAGGVVVLAHPGQYKHPMLMEMLIDQNYLDGLELCHPRNDKKTMEHITSLAAEHDLFVTGGTDFHGLYSKTPYPLGSFLCPEEGFERLKAAGEAANRRFEEDKKARIYSSRKKSSEEDPEEDADLSAPDIQ